MLKWHCRKVIFNQNSKKLKKRPLRGTPHNLSNVSLEVKELQVDTLLQVNDSKLRLVKI